MTKNQPARLSVIFCLLVAIISIFRTYIFSWFGDSFSPAIIGRFSTLLFYLSMILMAAAIFLFVIYAGKTGQGKTFAMIAGIVLILAFLFQIAMSFLYNMNDSAAYRIVLSAAASICSVQTAIALLAFQYTRACEKSAVPKGVGIGLLAVYALMVLLGIASQVMLYVWIYPQSAYQPLPGLMTVHSVLIGFSNLFLLLFLLLLIVACVLFLQKGKTLQPVSAPLSQPGQPGVCPHCGRSNGLEANFCAVCAAPLKPSAAPAPDPVQEPGPRCPSCGVPVTPDDAFCPLCGEKIGPTE